MFHFRSTIVKRKAVIRHLFVNAVIDDAIKTEVKRRNLGVSNKKKKVKYHHVVEMMAEKYLARSNKKLARYIQLRDKLQKMIGE